jgi:hypothetical protein
MRSRAQPIGTVQAPDRAAAEAEAVKLATADDLGARMTAKKRRAQKPTVNDLA